MRLSWSTFSLTRLVAVEGGQVKGGQLVLAPFLQVTALAEDVVFLLDVFHM